MKLTCGTPALAAWVTPCTVAAAAQRSGGGWRSGCSSCRPGVALALAAGGGLVHVQRSVLWRAVGLHPALQRLMPGSGSLRIHPHPCSLGCNSSLLG